MFLKKSGKGPGGPPVETLRHPLDWEAPRGQGPIPTMNLREELLIGKPLEPGQELLLSILLAREFATRITDERLFKPAGITDQQFNVLRILRGGPQEGYLIREIRRSIIARSACRSVSASSFGSHGPTARPSASRTRTSWPISRRAGATSSRATCWRGRCRSRRCWCHRRRP